MSDIEAKQEPAFEGVTATLRGYVESAYLLSTWAACINWRGGDNQKPWLDDLRKMIEDLQEQTVTARAVLDILELPTSPAVWKDVEIAPRNRRVIVVSKRFPQPHEAMLYDNGWHTWGVSGTYSDDPYLWTDLPKAPELPDGSSKNVFSDSKLDEEISRLASDFPHLNAQFKRVGDLWQCDLTTMTVLFGEYGIYAGEGQTRCEALLKARIQPDEQVAEKKRRAAAEAAKVEARKIIEDELDEEVFSEI